MTSVLIAGNAWAGEAVSTNDASHTLFNPVPESQLRSWHTDNAGLTPYTIDAGHFEAGLTPFHYGYAKVPAQKNYTPWLPQIVVPDEVEAWSYGALDLKAGLCQNVDIEATILPYTEVQTKTRIHQAGVIGMGIPGPTLKSDGFGDMTSRVKWNAWGNDGGKTALSFSGFVVFPTGAEGITADRYSGGPEAEFSVALPLELELIVNGSVELYGDGQEDAQANFYQSIGLQRPIVGKLDGFCMFETMVTTVSDQDWSGTIQPGLAYRLQENIEVFARSGFGVTGGFMDYEPAFGVRARF